MMFFIHNLNFAATCLLIFMSCSVFSQQTFDTLYSQYTRSSVIGNIIQAKNGALVIGGRCKDIQHSFASDLCMYSFDESGTKLWEGDFGGQQNEFDGYAIEGDSGSYILVGTTIIPSRQSYDDAYVVKVDSSGNKVWDKIFGGKSIDRGKLIIDDKQKGFFLIGETSSFSRFGKKDLFLLNMNQKGDSLSYKVLGIEGVNTVKSICHTPWEGYLLSSVVYRDSGDIINLYNLNSWGDTIWTKSISPDGFNILNRELWDSDSTLHNTVIIKGIDFIIEVDQQGQLLHTDTFQIGNSVEILANGDFVVGGDGLAKYDSSFTQIWHHSYSGMTIRDFTKAEDGGFYLAGPEWNQDSSNWGIDIRLIKTDCEGNVMNPVICNIQSLSPETNSLLTRIFPNPSMGLFTIKALDQSAKFSLYNPLGKQVFKKELESKMDTQINVSHLSTGCYFYHIQALNGSSLSGKLLVELP